MDREAWRAAVHGVTKSRTRLSEQQQQRAEGGQPQAILLDLRAKARSIFKRGADIPPWVQLGSFAGGGRYPGSQVTCGRREPKGVSPPGSLTEDVCRLQNRGCILPRRCSEKMSLWLLHHMQCCWQVTGPFARHSSSPAARKIHQPAELLATFL